MSSRAPSKGSQPLPPRELPGEVIASIVRWARRRRACVDVCQLRSGRHHLRRGPDGRLKLMTLRSVLTINRAFFREAARLVWRDLRLTHRIVARGAVLSALASPRGELYLGSVRSLYVMLEMIWQQMPAFEALLAALPLMQLQSIGFECGGSDLAKDLLCRFVGEAGRMDITEFTLLSGDVHGDVIGQWLPKWGNLRRLDLSATTDHVGLAEAIGRVCGTLEDLTLISMHVERPSTPWREPTVPVEGTDLEDLAPLVPVFARLRRLAMSTDIWDRNPGFPTLLASANVLEELEFDLVSTRVGTEALAAIRAPALRSVKLGGELTTTRRALGTFLERHKLIRKLDVSKLSFQPAFVNFSDAGEREIEMADFVSLHCSDLEDLTIGYLPASWRWSAPPHFPKLRRLIWTASSFSEYFEEPPLLEFPALEEIFLPKASLRHGHLDGTSGAPHVCKFLEALYGTLPLLAPSG
ncbi:hypothetical protein DFJ74DRAFT_674879 [Hyaloraphidium curvatum]|nr:hypothetical protein DFJ74DRAFT_674879 [Hyaloraphidium curvatum]